jgi:hypothetical protein
MDQYLQIKTVMDSKVNVKKPNVLFESWKIKHFEICFYFPEENEHNRKITAE